MGDSVLFRRVLFGGFHRGDVQAYVEQLEERNEKILLSKNDEIRRCQEEISRLQEEIDRLQGEIELWGMRYDELENSTSLIRQMETQLNEVQDEASRIIARQKEEAEEILQNVKSRVAVLIARQKQNVPAEPVKEEPPEDARDHVIKLNKWVV